MESKRSDELGNWMGGFARRVGFTTSLSAEMWAIRDGLKIAIDRAIYRLILETDCEGATLLLNSAISHFHSLGTLISDCRMLPALFHEVEINHVLLEANAAANYFAKLGAKSDLPSVILDECTTELTFTLYADAMGNTVPRTIVRL
ncbi:hypothetical protein SLA2020_512430 [Shorea laevis]